MTQTDATNAKIDRALRTTVTARSTRLPTYRERAPYGRAIVTLTDAKTKQRKDFWLGEFGSRASHEAYNRIIAQWLGNGKVLPSDALQTRAEHSGSAGTTLTINELALAYWKYVQVTYDERVQAHLRGLIRPTRQFFGTTPAIEFGPNDLRLVREAMIKGDENADPPRKPWTRQYVNAQVHRLCRMFRWGASHEMIPAEICVQLRAVPALRRGQTPAHDNDAVLPVPIERVDAIRPFLSRQVTALVDLQLLTGARSGELLKLRPRDIRTEDASGVWTVSLTNHKNAHRGQRRVLYLGPRAQAVLKPFLDGRADDAFLISPREADAEHQARRAASRKTRPIWGNTPGTNRVERRRKEPGACYTQHLNTFTLRLEARRGRTPRTASEAIARRFVKPTPRPRGRGSSSSYLPP